MTERLGTKYLDGALYETEREFEPLRQKQTGILQLFNKAGDPLGKIDRRDEDGPFVFFPTGKSMTKAEVLSIWELMDAVNLRASFYKP